MFTPALPLSGVAGFRFLENTEAQQRAALAADPEISREIAYFEENIGKVQSVDELLADRRLLQVALTAYGLESEIDKTSFVKQVLESDVGEDGSFANRLNDRRWQDFARDFGFGDPNAGREQTAFQIAVNLRVDGATPEFQPEERDLIDAFALEHFRREAPGFSTAQDLIDDGLSLSVALKAFDIDRTFYSDAAILDFIENGVETESGNEAFDAQFGAEMAKWRAFSEAFAGLSSTGAVVQTSRFGLEVEQAILRNGVSLVSSEEAAADPRKITQDDLDAFLAAVDGFASADDLVNDATALRVVKAAFGLENETLTDSAVAALLEAGPEAAQSEDNFGWVLLADAFGDNFEGGVQVTLPDYERAVELEITRNRLEALPTDFQPPAPPEIDPDELAYFNAAIGDIESPEQLVADKRLLDVAMRVFGLENETRSDDYIVDLLSEDPYSETSFVQLAGDERWIAFAQAFTPPADGEGLGRDVIQFELETRLKQIGAPQADIDYLRRNINIVDEPLDLVFDPQLKDIALSAFGLPKDSFSNTFVLNALISDPADPNAFVNRLGDPRWVAFAETFGAGATAGNVGLESFQADVVRKFQDRSFEIAVGSQDADLRLALNFRRAIQDIAAGPAVAEAGWLRILGDDPLRQVVVTQFGLPANEFAQLNLDAQTAELSERAARLFGGSDPSVFLSAENVDTAITRFLSLNAQASQASTTSAVTTLLQQTVSIARGVDARV